MDLNKYSTMLLLFIVLFLTACQPAEETDEMQLTVIQATPDKYIIAEEYLQLHPEEKKISSRFSEIVLQDAVPVPSAIQEELVIIAFVYPSEQISDYWVRSLQSFKKRMDELHISYKIYDFFSKSGGIDIQKQEQQLKDALALDPDYLVFTLDVSLHRKRIEQILAKKRPQLILQNITTPLSIWEGKQPFYVGFDHAIGTRMLADYFLKESTPDRPYGLLYYSKGYVSAMRGDTFLNYMQEGNGPPLAGSFYTDGKREKAYQATLSLTAASKDLQFLYACSTDVALGALDALKEQNLLDTVKVNGWGGGSAELEALARGDLEVTVMRMNDDNGVAMAEIIRLQLLDRNDEVPTIFSGEFSLISKNSPKEEIVELKKRAFRYSGTTDNK